MTFSQQIELTAANALIDAAVHYQICDIATCVVDSQDVRFEIRHSEAAATSAVLNAPNDASVAAADSGCGNQDLWRLFLLCLGAGFIAVLTPCVFPMVPLTVSIFTKRGSPTRAQGIRNALSYSLSIIAIYTLLGILLSVLFGANILRDIANNPWFNLAFFALLVIFGLSFLGLFELTLPSSWSTKFTQQGSKGGFMGTFFLAMALAVVSFACTGPLVATALISAADGSCFSSPIIAMLGFSTGLAFPFGFLAFAPNLLRKMPKSGNWMNTVKVTLGLLEIGFALTYLSGADLVSHWGLLDREIFLAIWIVIAFVLGFNLLGKLPIGHVEPEYDEMGSVIQNPPVSVARLLMGGTALVFMLYLIPGLWGAPLPMINGFLPPVNKDMGTVVIGGGASSSSGNAANEICNTPKKYPEISEHTPPGFCAFYDLEEGLAYAKAHKKPVFLDFTGFNCKNCRYVEGISWVDAAARQMLTNDYVMISLFTDDAAKLDEMKVLADGTKLRTRGNIWLEYQKKTFNQNSSPYYVLMDADQRVFAQMGYDGSGEAFTPTFVNFLKDGLKQANAQL
jgi:thiol:disulfide interchange protein DsbD